nr:hypothetical protein [Psychrobacter sp. PraFG1]UNK06639.1 hypothetical protein MN210_13130 [Psychrobacter sp. PraFG1]
MTTSRQQYGFNSSSAHSRLRLTHFRLTRLCYASLLLSVLLLMIGCQSIGSVTGVNGPAHSAPTASRQVADIRTQMAAQYLNTGQLDAAQRQLNRALEADKAYAPAYDMQALLLQREGSAHNWAQADRFFVKRSSMTQALCRRIITMGCICPKVASIKRRWRNLK